MASRTRRARVVLGVVALAVVGLGVWAWEPLWWLVTTRVRFYQTEMDIGNVNARMWVPVRGQGRVHRWNGEWHGKGLFYHPSNGYLAAEIVWQTGRVVRSTRWKEDGRVYYQSSPDQRERESAPWLWGVTDQTAPSMPEWILDDKQWQAALDAQE